MRVRKSFVAKALILENFCKNQIASTLSKCMPVRVSNYQPDRHLEPNILPDQVFIIVYYMTLSGSHL